LRILALTGVLAVLVCAACADNADPGGASHLTPGVTTRVQAISALGPPSSVYQAANGEKTVAWARGGGLFSPGETRQYAILFGPDDKMIRVVSQP
jgi:hypothetical protein